MEVYVTVLEWGGRPRYLPVCAFSEKHQEETLAKIKADGGRVLYESKVSLADERAITAIPALVNTYVSQANDKGEFDPEGLDTLLN